MLSGSYRLEEPIEPSFNLRLIEAVRHHRCLYDATDRQYKSSEFKLKVWNRLVQLLGFDGDNRTLATRWKQLRDKYGKEKKKAKHNNGVSSWQFYKQLQFLDPHMVDRATTGSPTRKENQEVRMLVTDPNFGLTLIEEVRAHPSLFGVRDDKYPHRNVAWQDIINNIGYPGDVISIGKQWKKIRDRYVREKKRLRELRDRGLEDESTWEFYPHMLWMDSYLDDRSQHRPTKRKQDTDCLSEYELEDFGRPESVLGFSTMTDKRGVGGGGGGDVLLDGDSAFAASAVSDLRTLPEHARALAKAQIESLLETGRMPITTSTPY